MTNWVKAGQKRGPPKEGAISLEPAEMIIKSNGGGGRVARWQKEKDTVKATLDGL